jgi:nucleoside-diphosphate-sugar epimerase
MPAPKRRLNVNTAMRLAAVLEWLYRTLRIAKEPPLTKYGVSVLTHSKTFDVSRMLADLGPPSVSIAEGIEQFIRWQQQHG